MPPAGSCQETVCQSTPPPRVDLGRPFEVGNYCPLADFDAARFCNMHRHAAGKSAGLLELATASAADLLQWPTIMARPLRVSFPGACYHIMARGNAKALMFLDAEDYRRFLSLVDEVASRFSMVLFGYCLMPNHYHLVCRTHDANISAAIAYLNGVYAQWWNHRHDRCGHLTQGRFKAQLIHNDIYLRVVCRYVLDNPVRAGLVRHPEDWEWSSARAAAGHAHVQPWLDTSLAGLDEPRPVPEPSEARGQGHSTEPPDYLAVAVAVRDDRRFVGDRTNLEPFRSLIRLARSARLPRREWAGIRPTLAELFACAGNAVIRNRQILAAWEDWGFTRKEIAEYLGLHPETVTRTVREQRRRMTWPEREV